MPTVPPRSKNAVEKMNNELSSRRVRRPLSAVAGRVVGGSALRGRFPFPLSLSSAVSCCRHFCTLPCPTPPLQFCPHGRIIGGELIHEPLAALDTFFFLSHTMSAWRLGPPCHDSELTWMTTPCFKREGRMALISPSPSLMGSREIRNGNEATVWRSNRGKGRETVTAQ